MPTIASVRSRVEREGQPVTVTRILDGGGTVSATAPGFVRSYQPHELVGGIVLGDREVRFAVGSLLDAGFPSAPHKPDFVEIDGQEATVQESETRWFRGLPCLYIVQVRGG